MELLYGLPLWAIGAGGMLLLVASAEAGFRAGRSQGGADGQGGSGEFSTVQGAILGLLGLLLAFTYSLAAGRHDTRKQLVIQEANAIGTVWLRAGLAPAPHGAELQDLLRRYVDLRLELAGAPIFDARTGTVSRRSEEVQGALWSVVSRMTAGGEPTRLDVLVIEALNEVIDLHSARLAALRDHVPESVLFLLVFVAMIALALVGFAAGTVRRRSLAMTTVLSGLITVVLVVTLDFDRPRRGLITVSQQAMEDLQKSLQPGP